MTICENCGNKFETGIFCPECGEKCKEQIISTCLQCNSQQNTSDWKFCSEGGYKNINIYFDKYLNLSQNEQILHNALIKANDDGIITQDEENLIIQIKDQFGIDDSRYNKIKTNALHVSDNLSTSKNNTDSTDTRDQFKLGLMYFEKGIIDKAKFHLQKSVDSGNHLALNFLGNIALSENSYEKAFSFFKASITIKPSAYCYLRLSMMTNVGAGTPPHLYQSCEYIIKALNCSDMNANQISNQVILLTPKLWASAFEDNHIIPYELLDENIKIQFDNKFSKLLTKFNDYPLLLFQSSMFGPSSNEVVICSSGICSKDFYASFKGSTPSMIGIQDLNGLKLVNFNIIFFKHSYKFNHELVKYLKLLTYLFNHLPS